MDRERNIYLSERIGELFHLKPGEFNHQRHFPVADELVCAFPAAKDVYGPFRSKNLGNGKLSEDSVYRVGNFVAESIHDVLFWWMNDIEITPYAEIVEENNTLIISHRRGIATAVRRAVCIPIALQLPRSQLIFRWPKTLWEAKRSRQDL